MCKTHPILANHLKKTQNPPEKYHENTPQNHFFKNKKIPGITRNHLRCKLLAFFGSNRVCMPKRGLSCSSWRLANRTLGRFLSKREGLALSCFDRGMRWCLGVFFLLKFCLKQTTQQISTNLQKLYKPPFPQATRFALHMALDVEIALVLTAGDERNVSQLAKKRFSELLCLFFV